MTSENPIRLRRILVFWMPMAVTWLMMSVEGPFLAAIIARLASPKQNLAAFGVAFAIAIIIEAPVIMMMSASTALVTGRQSYRRLRNFTYSLNAVLTIGMLLLLLTPAFETFAGDLIGLPDDVVRLTRNALLLLLPWPAAIGYRRFFQGLLIRDGATRRVAYGTATRLVTMSLTAFAGIRTDMAGVSIGALALSAGVCCEALFTRAMSRDVVRRLRCKDDHSDRPESRTYGGIARFYYPLALTSMIALSAQPVVTFFMGQARNSLESLAVLPVIHALSFIFRSVGLSYQEVSIALLDRGRQNLRPVLQFGTLLAITAAGALASIAFTPLADVWFRGISGLSRELTGIAVPPSRILSLMPALSVLLSLQRALLVHGRATRPISWSSAAEVSAIAALLFVTINYLDLIGATAAAIALMAGRLAANFTLLRPCVRIIRSGAETAGVDQAPRRLRQ